MRIVLFASLLISAAVTPFAFADDKNAPGDEPDFAVEVDTRVYPKKAFEQKGVKVGETPSRVKRADALPDKTDREKIFARVPGLDAEVAKMDEMDRDLLFVRARTKPLKELAKTYPAIPEKTLARLRKELGAK